MSALSSATRTRPRVLSVAGAGRPAGASGVGSSASVDSAPSGSQRRASATKDSASGEGSRGSVVVSSGGPCARRRRHDLHPVRPPERDRHRHRGAHTGLAGRADLAVVQPDELAHQRQADAAALAGARAGALDAVEALEQARQLVGGHPDTGVLDVQDRGVGGGLHAHRDPPGGGELQGVGEQVEHDLLPRVPVEQDRSAHRRAVDDVVEARARHRGREHRRELRGGRAEVDGHGVGLAAAGLEPREVEQAVDHPPEALPVAVHHLELGAPALGVHLGRGAQLGDRAHDQGQRGAELVADVGEEVGLRAVELGERLGAAPFGLVAARVGEARRDLAAEQLQEARGALVELPVGVDARDEDAGDRRRPRRPTPPRAARAPPAWPAGPTPRGAGRRRSGHPGPRRAPSRPPAPGPAARDRPRARSPRPRSRSRGPRPALAASRAGPASSSNR